MGLLQRDFLYFPAIRLSDRQKLHNTGEADHESHQMTAQTQPAVIPRGHDDHRYVAVSELMSLTLYDPVMSPKGPSTIQDFAMSSPHQFLKSTSRWTENHLVAFRCLLLENLPTSRIVSPSDLPGDEDPSMRLVQEHLMATEDEVRSGTIALKLGPATTFYRQLQVVLRRPPTPPAPIPISRSFRPSTLNTVFPPIPESQSSSTSGSSFQPSPPSTRNIVPSTGQAAVDTGSRSRTSMDSVQSDMSLSSTDEDKLETVANQAAVTLLGLLCTFEETIEPDNSRRLNLRFHHDTKSTLTCLFSNEALPPTLMVHGEPLASYNDGSYFIETRSTRRPHEWVKRDAYPRASLQVKISISSRRMLS